ncbi:UrcA family protein [Sandarakinorhabdus sp.]|uniref:UrcA family protein n=1 Tax=Sandarakinorhabdus sp. TaxID=1916663 RepID=UPI00286DA8C1|nr:UrcA family protein [Sandarakinorhabdus sp.]
MFASAQNFSRNVVGAAGTLFFAGLCIAGATATPANAQIAYGVSEAGHRVAYVSYADLNLASQAGRSSLETRIRSAAKRVCSATVSDYRAQTEQQRCFSTALQATRNATMAAIEADKLAV